MIRRKLRRRGNSFVITIPKREVERLHLYEGQSVLIDVQPLELRSVLSAELREVLDESWQQNATGYRALAEK